MRETIQNTNGKQFHAVSLSGGKDSSAMLLLMIERDMPIDMVLSADTGMEFPEMYEHLAKLDEHLFRERGIHITTLRHPKGFEYLMFDEPKQKPRSLENRAKLGIPPYGNGWPGIRVRWCTGQLKTHLITKEVNRLKGELGAIHYVFTRDFLYASVSDHFYQSFFIDCIQQIELLAGIIFEEETDSGSQ
jgi:3'-phosphoadenosine 5'-phosphosulfate sulfotransferase (PAPS reductase)/FAD synthetase